MVGSSLFLLFLFFFQILKLIIKGSKCENVPSRVDQGLRTTLVLQFKLDAPPPPLGIQSYSQMMIRVSNHLLSIVFRFHYHSQKVIGSLGLQNILHYTRIFPLYARRMVRESQRLSKSLSSFQSALCFSPCALLLLKPGEDPIKSPGFTS